MAEQLKELHKGDTVYVTASVRQLVGWHISEKAAINLHRYPATVRLDYSPKDGLGEGVCVQARGDISWWWVKRSWVRKCTSLLGCIGKKRTKCIFCKQVIR